MNNLIHPKESSYKTMMFVFAGIGWLLIGIPFVAAIAIALPFILVFLLISWITSLILKAQLLGDSIKVTTSQYPEIHNKVIEYCERTGIDKIPDVFVFNSNGVLNAFAVKFFESKYVFLTSAVVDLSYKNDSYDQLNFIIGHELGHHAAGHTSMLRNFFLIPAKVVPFIGAAYSRACELTADRYGCFLNGNIESSINSLVLLAHGSKVLSDKTNVDAFIDQEYEISGLPGFMAKLYATHPRITRRVIELKEFGRI